ncbi:MAG: signal peptidase I [Candidatus Omnitrophica bacterium]|nr:signal peptidase I [Candidatus Omnitrophota bacterium]
MQNKEKIKYKSSAQFSHKDFKDFSALIAKIRTGKNNPFYLELEKDDKAFIDRLDISSLRRKEKNEIADIFNKKLADLRLYEKLLKVYGQWPLEEKLSQPTKNYRDKIAVSEIERDNLKGGEKEKIFWLNLYLLTDLFKEEITQIRKQTAVREWLDALIVAGVLAIFVRTFFFQIYKIPTTSMVPTLMPGDKIFVSKLSYGPQIPFTNYRFKGFSKMERGDIVVFIPPDEAKKGLFQKKRFVKRLIGLPGDKIEIVNGNLVINGRQIVDPRMATPYYTNQGIYGRQGYSVTVPDKKYFFLGDNSVNSQDSRFWGFADENEIIGKAIFLWWPYTRIGMLE